MLVRYDTGGGVTLARAAVEIRVLGSSGAASPERRSTAFLVGEDLAIDAGSLASGLPLEGQRRIRTILLSHRHFDHIRELPLFLDNIFASGNPSVEIGAERENIALLEKHIFNNDIWPDFKRFTPPPAEFFSIAPGRAVTRSGLRITPVRLYHTVPSLGFIFERGSAAAAVLGDTGYGEGVFDALAAIDGLRFLTIETSYPSRLADLARTSRHLTPALLEKGLAVVRKANPRLRVVVNHLKPAWEEETEKELEAIEPKVTVAKDGDRFVMLPR